MKIPLYKPYIRKEETNAVLRVLKSAKLSHGKEIESFEKEFSKYTKKKYAIAVNSGTSGLHLLVRALDWKSGDEIITTPFSYIASSNVLLLEKATPVFVDIDSQTLNIDCSKIEEKITSRTKGILLVHVLGLPVNYNAIKRIRDKYNLQIIEDACEAIGRPTNEFPVTRIGEATVYGFHENKQLTSGGEGGMIVTDDPVIVQKCWSMRDQGRSVKKDWINDVVLGFNFRMTEMQAAFGRAQLKKIEKMLKRRNKIAAAYFSLFKNIDGISIPQINSETRSWFFYFVLFNDPRLRDKTHKVLLKAGIESNINYFPPIYNFPIYKKYRKGGYKNTDWVAKRLLALPTFYTMENSEIKQVVSIIKAVINNKR